MQHCARSIMSNQITSRPVATKETARHWTSRRLIADICQSVCLSICLHVCRGRGQKRDKTCSIAACSFWLRPFSASWPLIAALEACPMNPFAETPTEREAEGAVRGGKYRGGVEPLIRHERCQVYFEWGWKMRRRGNGEKERRKFAVISFTT